jgi:hypothetical protein
MQPTAGDVHVNTPLTNISVAMMQSASNFIGVRAFPNIPVSKQSDAYFTYDRGYFNRDEMKERAPGTESEGGGYIVDANSTYFCRVYAYHKDVHDQIRSNADAALNLDREATMFVTQKAMIRREVLWGAAYFTAGIWTGQRTGHASLEDATNTVFWNNSASDPINRVRDWKRAVLELTGFEPNKLVLGKAVYDTLLDHPDVIDRLKYGQAGVGSPAMANRERLAQLFEVDEILVSCAIQNTAGEGATNAHSFILGKHALLCYAPPAAGLMTPSAGYTFSWTGYMGASDAGTRIKQFRLEQLEADRVEIQMAFACKQVAADLGFFAASIVQ